MHRLKTKNVRIGGVVVGGGSPVSIQSMTTTDTTDVQKTMTQINRLYKAGCEIVRVSVPDEKAAHALKTIVLSSPIPVVADIHFDYELAVLSIRAGADGVRINPGNIGSQKNIAIIAKAAACNNIPIRIGINAGSLEKDILKRYGKVSAEALVESALQTVHFLESIDFGNIIVSLKASDLPISFRAYVLMAEKSNYPLHIGITEAGTKTGGTVKSSIGIGSLLLMGIGDTIRVSLTADPVEEIKLAQNILQAVNLRFFGPELISCPTCGRCRIDLIALAEQVEEKLKNVSIPLKVAVMGCVVNGPGEAKEADVGICGGQDNGILFSRGKIIKKLPFESLVDSLMEEIELIKSAKSSV